MSRASRYLHLQAVSLIPFGIAKMRSSFTHFTVALQLLGLTAASYEVPTHRRRAIPANNTYDYVIVGGGVTGLIVANRLTEDKSSKYRLN